MTIGQALASFLTSPPGLALYRVTSREDWVRVSGLRYNSLAGRGEVVACADGLHSDAYDLARNSSTFLLLRNGRAAASTRTTVTTPERPGTLPAMEVFGREIGASLGRDASIVEASLTVADSASGLDPRLGLVHVLKAPMIECAALDVEWLLTAVQEDEIGFYRRMLNMEILSGAETCPGVASPRVLMGLPYREQSSLVYKRLPALAVTASDIAEYSATGIVRFAEDAARHHAA